MSVIEGFLMFIAILLLYSFIVFILHRKKIFEKYHVSFFGPALMWRTTKGIDFLKRLARRKRFWNAFGSFGIVLCIITMILMTFLLVWQAWAVLGFTAEQKEALPGPEIALVLPGINPILPLEYIGYIILAFIVAIVVHEFAHGILTIASKLKVKSLGILYLIIPVGAFCEPDEEELKTAQTKPRMRIYAAGPTANFVVVLLSIFVFSFVLMSAVQPAADGPIVFTIDGDSPADDIGLRPGSIITSLNDTTTLDGASYFLALNVTQANQTIAVSYVVDGKTYEHQVTLTDKYDEYAKRPSLYVNNETYMGKGYLGVQSLLRDSAFQQYTSILKNPFTQFPVGILTFYILPLTGYFAGYNPITDPFTSSYVLTGPLSVIPTNLFWIIINALYWIFWLNFALALFNVLPIGPFDGGMLFNDAMQSVVRRVKKDLTKEQRELAVKNISIVLSLLVLLLIAFPWIIKYLFPG